jgi:hypothetical protein
MLSDIIVRGCAPDDTHPLVDTVARASNAELATIYTFWQSQPDTINVRMLAINIIERETLERVSVDATDALTPGQQQRVMTFARGAPATIDAFERFYIVNGADSESVWIVYSERQLGRARAHAIQVDSDGTVCGAVEGELAEPLSQLPIVNIIPLFAEDESDTLLLNSFKPPLKLLDTAMI